MLLKSLLEWTLVLDMTFLDFIPSTKSTSIWYKPRYPC